MLIVPTLQLSCSGPLNFRTNQSTGSQLAVHRISSGILKTMVNEPEMYMSRMSSFRLPTYDSLSRTGDGRTKIGYIIRQSVGHSNYQPQQLGFQRTSNVTSKH